MNHRSFVNPSTLVTPPGPFSHVVRVGDLAFVAGQTGCDASGTLVGPGVVEQARQAVANIRDALEAVDLALTHIVKVTLFLAYESDLDELVPYMDEEFPQHFSAGLPPSTLVVVNRLFAPEMRIEIEVVAHA